MLKERLVDHLYRLDARAMAIHEFFTRSIGVVQQFGPAGKLPGTDETAVEAIRRHAKDIAKHANILEIEVKTLIRVLDEFCGTKPK